MLMGRDEIEMSILKAVNGLEDGCKINFHGILLWPSILKASEADSE